MISHHFEGQVDGAQGHPATRCGGVSSGIRATAWGQHIKVHVVGKINKRGKEEFKVYVTNGQEQKLLTITEGGQICLDSTQTSTTVR